MTVLSAHELRQKASRCRELAQSLGNLRDQSALNEFADVLHQQAEDIDGEQVEPPAADPIPTLLSALRHS